MSEQKTVFIILAATLSLLLIMSSAVMRSESQDVNNSSVYSTYNDTAYGISINYPSNWEVDESSYQYILSLFQNLSSTEWQNDTMYDDMRSKVSEVLHSFGLKSLSDIFGLSKDKRTEFIQFTSKVLREGDYQVLVILRPVGEHSNILGSLNIVSGNISSLTPISLSEYMDESIDTLKILTPDLTIDQQPKEIVINGVPAMTIIHHARNPLYESHTFKFLTAIFIKGETVYILTFSSPPEIYPTLLPTFNSMLESFKINNKTNSILNPIH